MGLATSQVRLLALTSRKADVEMQIQLNSKRKTMLTREATELSKLYYAKLQNSKIMYSTTNGNKEVNYEYLMAPDSAAFFDDILNSTASSGYDRKTSDSMILTDSYGRVILSDTMADIVIETLNNDGIPGNKGDRTVESMTLDALNIFLKRVSGEEPATMGVSTSAKSIYKMYNDLYTGAAFGGESPSENGFKVLETLYKNGYKSGGTIYEVSTGVYCTDYKKQDETKLTLKDLTDGTFYTVKDASNFQPVYKDVGNQGCLYLNEAFVPTVTATKAQQLCRVLNYYGAIFSAAFSGSRTFGTGGSTTTVNHYNLSANIKKNADGKFELDSNETYYNIKQNNSNLQEGLKSGLYQLVNVDNIVTGSYAKAQGLNYFKTQNYVVEQTDSGERETITAWYNAARADLNTKESYWDSEITALSAELNSITTEIDSVKKLREDAISSTFKWGGA